MDLTIGELLAFVLTVLPHLEHLITLVCYFLNAYSRSELRPAASTRAVASAWERKEFRAEVAWGLVKLESRQTVRPIRQ